MIQKFKTRADFNAWLDGNEYPSGVISVIEEDKSYIFATNNLDGVYTTFESVDAEEIEKHIVKSLSVTENGTFTPANENEVWDKVVVDVNTEQHTIKTLNVTANGTYTPSEGVAYGKVTVNVPDPVLETLDVTENGTYNGQYNKVNVNVEDYHEVTQLGVSANGIFRAPNAWTVWDEVTVNVPDPVFETLNVTANGTYNGQYNKVNVNVPSEGEQMIKGLIDNTFNGDLIIPNGTTSIKNYCFQYGKMTSVTIPSSVTSIGSQAFNQCSSLLRVNSNTNGEIIIPDTVTSIGSYSFQYVNSDDVTKIVIGNKVKTIGQSAFNDIRNVKTIIIGSGVTKLDGQCFYTNNYTSTPKVTVTINATTPPTAGNQIFKSANLNAIYVPSASVEAYKTATNWTSFADKIFPIE